MSNRAGIFVSADCTTLLQNHEGDLLTGGTDQDYSTGCVRTLSFTAPVSVYTLMFSYFTASDIFMEENLFILGTKLDLIINKLRKNNKLIIRIPAEKVFLDPSQPCYRVFISSPRMIVIVSSAGE